jgi:hypothetical protein
MATGIPRETAAGVPGPPPAPAQGGWTPGRVIAVVAGSLLALVALGLLGGGGTLLWATHALRQDGYVTTGTATYSTSGYALTTERVNLGWDLLLPGLVGDVRIRVTAVSTDKPVFVAIGPTDRVSAYLSGTAYTTVSGTGAGGLTVQEGTRTPAPPGAAGIWVAKATGSGTQVLRWTAQQGDWTAVAMNADGSAGVSVRADAGVSAPGLARLAAELITGGIIACALAAALIWVPVQLASRK